MWGLIKEEFNFLNLNLSTGEFIALDSFDAILTFLIGAGIIIGGVIVGIWVGFENIKKLFKKDEGY